MNNEYDPKTPARKHALDLTVIEWTLVLWSLFCAQTVLGMCIAIPVGIVYALSASGRDADTICVLISIFGVVTTVGIILYSLLTKK